jgi:hypothetical protein
VYNDAGRRGDPEFVILFKWFGDIGARCSFFIRSFGTEHLLIH